MPSSASELPHTVHAVRTSTYGMITIHRRPTKDANSAEATCELRPESLNSTKQLSEMIRPTAGPRSIDSAASNLAQLYEWYKKEGLIFPEPFIPDNQSQDPHWAIFLESEPYRIWHTVIVSAGRHFFLRLSPNFSSQHYSILEGGSLSSKLHTEFISALQRGFASFCRWSPCIGLSTSCGATPGPRSLLDQTFTSVDARASLIQTRRRYSVERKDVDRDRVVTHHHRASIDLFPLLRQRCFRPCNDHSKFRNQAVEVQTLPLLVEGRKYCPIQTS